MGVDKTQNRKKKTALVYGVNFLLTALLFLLFTVLISSGSLSRLQSNLVILVCINVLMAVSLNLVTGVLGQLVLGHAGFMLVGAYTAALFTKSSGLPLEVALPIGLLLAGLVAAVFSVVIGIPALRLRGDYLAIITLGFGEIIRVVANNLDFIGGAQGLSGIPSPDKLTLFLYSSVLVILEQRQLIGGRNTGQALTLFLYSSVLVILAVFLMFTFGRSRHGRAVISIREDEIAAESSGVNTTYYKLMAFVLAAFLAGIAGGLYAHHVGMVDPSKYDFNRSVEFLIMVVLGGMGSITGSIISATVLTILPQMLTDFDRYRMLIYSIILIVVMLFRPTGLLGRYEISVTGLAGKLRDRIKGRSRKKEEV